MPPFIDTTFFTGSLYVAQLNKVAVQEELTYFIAKYEKNFLRDLLGYALYKDFMAAFNASNTAPSIPLAAQWDAILNGIEFTDQHQVLRKWTGLLGSTENGEIELSVIAQYVYYHFIRQQMSFTTGNGEVKNTLENATNVTASRKLIAVWNDMVESTANLITYLYLNPVTYPEYVNYRLPYDFRSTINDWNI
jgi:hypothetical protein